MKLDAPFWLLKDIVTDAIYQPKNIYSFLSQYQNERSFSYPAGKLPIADILEFVPDAKDLPITLQGIFEIPAMSRHLPNEEINYTASTTLKDSYSLALLTKRFVKTRILEVGTSFGQSALLFALNSPSEATIETLDIQSENITVGEHFKNHPLSEKITQHFSTLHNLLPKLTPRSYDLIFIDGDHSYKGVMEDTIAALTLIRPGGIICWHDYSFRFRHDVVVALDDIRKENNIDIRKIAYTNVSVAIIA